MSLLETQEVPPKASRMPAQKMIFLLRNCIMVFVLRNSLLKVIVGFSWSMLLLEDLLAVIHVLPLFVLILLVGLELGVAIIQAYVFTILTCIYLNDGINLH